MVPEKIIENHILQFLSYSPHVFVFKVQSTGMFDPTKKIFRKSFNKNHIKGVSDILGIIKPTGQFLAIEVKSKVGKLSPEQKVFLDKVQSMGGVAFVARSLEEVKERLAPWLKYSAL